MRKKFIYVLLLVICTIELYGMHRKKKKFHHKRTGSEKSWEESIAEERIKSLREDKSKQPLTPFEIELVQEYVQMMQKGSESGKIRK